MYYTIHIVPKKLPEKEGDYLKKEDYGKVPEYLKHVKEEIRRENEMIENYVKSRINGMKEEVTAQQQTELDENERRDLIEKLKARWELINAQYQKTTHIISMNSCGMIRRKEECERILKELESDIEKLSHPGKIVIVN